MFEKYFQSFNKLFHRPQINVYDDIGLGVDIRRLWNRLCVFLGVVFVIIFILDYYFFYSSSNLNSSPSLANSDFSATVDLKKLKRVVEDWDARNVDFYSHENSVPTIVDPSL